MLPHAIVNVRLPADGLQVQRLPTDEDVVRRLALQYLFKLVLQVFGGCKPAIGAIDSGGHIGTLTGSPVPQRGVDQLFQRLAALAIRCSQLVVVHQRMETILAPIPNMPHKRSL
jgi:hypothetical protein